MLNLSLSLQQQISGRREGGIHGGLTKPKTHPPYVAPQGLMWSTQTMPPLPLQVEVDKVVVAVVLVGGTMTVMAVVTTAGSEVVDGLAVEGFAVEGLGIEGLGVDGLGVEGFAVDGFGVEGLGVEGLGVDGFGVEDLVGLGIVGFGGVVLVGLGVRTLVVVPGSPLQSGATGLSSSLQTS